MQMPDGIQGQLVGVAARGAADLHGARRIGTQQTANAHGATRARDSLLLSRDTGVGPSAKEL